MLDDEKRVENLSYEDLKNDFSIKIFDLEFSINIDGDYQKKLVDVANKMKNEENNLKVLEEGVNCLLGSNAYERIKSKYYSDLGKEIDEFVWIKVIYFVMENIQKYMNNLENINMNNNRSQRRYNNYNNHGRYNKYNKYRRF